MFIDTNLILILQRMQWPSAQSFSHAVSPGDLKVVTEKIVLQALLGRTKRKDIQGQVYRFKMSMNSFMYLLLSQMK